MDNKIRKRIFEEKEALNPLHFPAGLPAIPSPVIKNSANAKHIMVSIGKNPDVLYLLKLLALKQKKHVYAVLAQMIQEEAKKYHISQTNKPLN